MGSQENTVFTDSNFRPRCYRHFEDMRLKGEFCDIILTSGCNTISAHRVVLAAGIPFFRETLAPKDNESSIEEVKLNEINWYALESLINFAYSGTIEISPDNVEVTLEGSVALNLEQVTEACCDFLIKRLNAENVMNTKVLASNLNCLQLAEAADHYASENFDLLSRTEHFLHAPFSYVMELISRDELGVSSEETVFEFVINWVQKLPAARRSKLPDLLHKVRLALLSPNYLTDRAGAEKLIQMSVPCKDLLDEARIYQQFPEKRPLVKLDCRPRSHNPKIAHLAESSPPGIYAISKRVSLDIQYLLPEKGEWNSMESIPFASTSGTLAEVNNRLYFMDSGFIREYNSLVGCWSPNRKVFGSALNVGFAVLDDKIYFCGGLADGKPLDTVECYDVKTNAYACVTTPMRERRNFHGVVALGRYLYALGGRYVQILNSVERFDPDTAQWTSVSAMCHERYGFGCAVLKGKIYVCGGKGRGDIPLSSAEVYDPLSDQWNLVTSMKTGRYWCSLVPYCGKLYAFGHYEDDGKSLNTVEIYDPELDEWEFGPPLKSSETHAQGAAIQC